MKTFTINGKKYTPKELNFDAACELEDYGVSLIDAKSMKSKNLALIRGYFGICAGLDAEDAAKEVQEHLASGGKLDGLLDALRTAMDDSSFFRALKTGTETGDGTVPSKEE